jgi:prepilin-type N-terminal cleavage/methylation domain-containing protein
MKPRRVIAAFTLIELLVVISIIGILAALVAPSLSHFRKGDTMLASTRQMLDAVSRARQLAISQRSTVYLVFMPDVGYWSRLSLKNPFADMTGLTDSERIAATNTFDKQLTGYTFVSLRTVGDQPGQIDPRYLSTWQTLPESTFVAAEKFGSPANIQLQVHDPLNPGNILFNIYGFATNAIPFPTAQSSYIPMPSVGFDYLGRLVSQRDEYIPLAHGSVLYNRDPQTKIPTLGLVSAVESPPGNSTNISYNVVHIDWLTGRARLERQEVQ